MVKVYALAGTVAVAALIGGTFWATMGHGTDCGASAVGGAIGGPFELIDTTGARVTDADVLTKPSLVYFGFTFCPDACPLDLARNAEALDLLKAEGHDVQGVFISVDPDRDTPDVVAEYVSYMHEDMVGLTGSHEQVKGASKAYKTYYQKQEAEDGDEFYLVDHTTFTYLMLPDGGFAEFFRRDDSPEKIAQATACFINAA